MRSGCRAVAAAAFSSRGMTAIPRANSVLRSSAAISIWEERRTLLTTSVSGGRIRRSQPAASATMLAVSGSSSQTSTS